jgi:hypothetical protein
MKATIVASHLRWENFKLTTSATPPVPTTRKDMAKIVACTPPK